MANKEPMESLLMIAVPLWINKLRWKSFEEFQSRSEAILESVCYKGDLLLYGSPRKGETAKLFNDLAEGLGWLALLAKGGVTFGDLHWDAEFLTDEEKMSDLRKESQERACKSQTLPSLLYGTGAQTEVKSDGGSDNSSPPMERKEAGEGNG